MKQPIPFDTAKECAADARLRGVRLGYPYLFAPDTKFDDVGIYRADLIMNASDAEAFQTLYQETLDAWIAKAGDFIKKPKAANSSPIVENDDGTVTVKAKLKAGRTDKDGNFIPNRPRVVDAKKQALDSSTRVGSGTTANVILSLWPWYSASLGLGVQVRLRAVQVLELVEYGGNAADDFDEEDGFTTEVQDSELQDADY